MSGMMFFAQAAVGGSKGPSPQALFYMTLLFIFLTAIVTTVATKWTRDKCLKFLHRYHITLQRGPGQTIWGCFKVFSSGVEMIFDHSYVDHRGRRKTSFLIFQPEIDQQPICLLRYDDELSDADRRRRKRQIRRTFNPGPLRRLWRGLRNFVNTLRDAFSAAIGAAVGQFQRMNPSSAVLSSQAGSVTTIGQTLLGRFGNAYEPLLEQYLGQPVILDVADPLDPNNAPVEFAGYLADYTQQYIAVFNVEHKAANEIVMALPPAQQGTPSADPVTAAAVPPVNTPVVDQQGIQVRIDKGRFKVLNMRADPVVIRRLEREGFEPVMFGAVIGPHATFDLWAHDAEGGRLVMDVARCLDVVVSRKIATVRHAGQLVERRGFVDELHLHQLPLVPKLMGAREEKK